MAEGRHYRWNLRRQDELREPAAAHCETWSAPMRIILGIAFIAVLALIPALVAAQGVPVIVGVELGSVTIHDRDREVAVGGTVAWGWQDDRLRLTTRGMLGQSYGGFFQWGAAFEMRLCGTACRVIPLAAVGLGGIADRSGPARVSQLTLGVDVRVLRDGLIRVGWLRGKHAGSYGGPSGFIIGFTHRFRR
jgi:hypothetical protein